MGPLETAIPSAFNSERIHNASSAIMLPGPGSSLLTVQQTAQEDGPHVVREQLRLTREFKLEVVKVIKEPWAMCGLGYGSINAGELGKRF